MSNSKNSSEGIEIFLSYSHVDEGLRDELEKHLSALKHEDLISVWHDRKIGAGEEWKGEIDDHFYSAQIILLLISPDFLASSYCYDVEMKRAMERHEKDEALVIPIVLRPVCWRNAPFGKLQALPRDAEPITSRKWGSADEAFFDVTKGLREAIKDFESKPISPPMNLIAIVVDQLHHGNHTTISDAIKAAKPGNRILVRPGIYPERIEIDKSLEIIGDGIRNEIIIMARGSDTLQFHARAGLISNLTLEQPSPQSHDCIDIVNGSPRLEYCDISGGKTCVNIHNGSIPKISHCSIHDSLGYGIYISDKGQGILTENDIFNNANAGIGIRTGGNPKLSRNRIHHNRHEGVKIFDGGQGFLEDNDIYCNGSSNVEVKGNSNPRLFRNRIYESRGNGVFVLDRGKGILEENDIFGNADSGITIKDSGNPTILRNRIHDGKGAGIYIFERGKGILEGNDIFRNIFPGVSIETEGNPILRRNRIYDGKDAGINIFNKGQGRIEENDVFRNEKSGVSIGSGSNPILLRNSIHDGIHAGIFILENGQGVLEENRIFNIANCGVAIERGSNPTLRRNKINGNSAAAIWINMGGEGVFEDNDLRNNIGGAWNVPNDNGSLIKRNRNLE